MQVGERDRELAPVRGWPRRRWGRRRILAVTALVLVIGLIASGLAYIANYMPIRSSGMLPGAACLLSGGDASLPGRPHSARLLDQACFEQGDEMVWGFSIRNDGPLPITITGAGGGDLRIGPWGPIDVGAYPETDHVGERAESVERVAGRFDETIPAFEPFTLAPGERFGHVLMYRMPLVERCPLDESLGIQVGTLAHVELTYKVLWFERRESFYAPVQVRLRC